MASNTMRVRVEQIGEVYYPQYRRLMMWSNCIKSVGYEAYESVKFDNLKDAEKYAKSLIHKVHKVEV